MGHGISNIKPENIRAVMTALTKEKALTRAELAARCHLSLTTVGKIVDALWALDIVSQQDIPKKESGRKPSRVHFTDTSGYILFRFTDAVFTMDLINFRLQLTYRFRFQTNPAHDPGDDLRTFLIRCRKELNPRRTHMIKLCGMVSENPFFENSVLEQAIRSYTDLTVSARDHTMSALARAALYLDIATEDQCTVGILDSTHFGGVMIHHGKIHEGGLANTAGLMHNQEYEAERVTQTLILLSAILSPDVLLLCTDRPVDLMREQLRAALFTTTLPHPVALSVHSADEFLTLGFGLALQESWLDHAIRREQALRA